MRLHPGPLIVLHFPMRTLTLLVALTLSCTSRTDIHGSTDAGHDPAETELPATCSGYVGLATPDEIASTPRDDWDSEMLALSVTDGLVADQAVYDRVYRDMLAIRSMDLSIVLIGVFGPHDGKTLHLEADPVTYASMQAGTYEDWTCPNAFYVAEEIEFFHSSWLRIEFEGIYDLWLLAAEYSVLAGVTTVQAIPPAGDGPTICLSVEGDLYHYVFDDAGGDCPAGCTEHRYVYYTTTPDGPPVYMDTWSSTFPVDPPEWVLLYGRC